jgi:spermidine synthase
LAFQIQYGDVYQYIGLLTALFMLGAAAASRWAEARGGRPLVAVESVLLLTILFAYAAALSAPSTDVWLGLVVLLITLTGLSTGAQYPVLVARVAGSKRGIGAPAGWIYVLDLWGAMLGATLAGVVLIPTLGLRDTLLLAAILKAGSLVLILSAPDRRPSP